MEVKQPGIKPVAMWNAGTPCGSIASCAVVCILIYFVPLGRQWENTCSALLLTPPNGRSDQNWARLERVLELHRSARGSAGAHPWCLLWLGLAGGYSVQQEGRPRALGPPRCTAGPRKAPFLSTGGQDFVLSAGSGWVEVGVELHILLRSGVRKSCCAW